MKKYLRSKRKETPYEDAEQFLKRELYRDEKPDEELSCNHVNQNETEKCLIEYKATNFPKPITKSIAGFFLPNDLNYNLKKETIGYFKLVKDTHHCLQGADNLTRIAQVGYNYNDVSLTKEQIWAFIDVEERKGNAEWKAFLATNDDWQKKLKNYRHQKKDAALKAWQSYGGGSFKEGTISRLMILDPAKTKELLSKIIETGALPQAELEDLKKYI